MLIVPSEGGLHNGGRSGELVGSVPHSHHHLVPEVRYRKMGEPAAVVVTRPEAEVRFR